MIKTIGVDFDGVIHRYSKGWFDGTIYDEPTPGALDGLRLLMQHGAVFIHTARSPRQAAEYLAEHGFETCIEGQVHAPIKFWTDRGRLLATNHKVPAVAYLDDRAVKFTSWEKALAELLPDGATPRLDAAAGLVSVPEEDLRRLAQLARCHVENLWVAPAEDLALVERIHAQLGGEQL